MPRYVIEHRTATETTIIASGILPLNPLAAHLAGQGKTGELVLLDAETGTIVIRVPLAPDDHPAERDPSRPA